MNNDLQDGWKISSGLEAIQADLKLTRLFIKFHVCLNEELNVGDPNLSQKGGGLSWRPQFRCVARWRSSVKVPDFENGFMMLNHNTANLWQTRVEAVLVKEAGGDSRDSSDDQDKYSYLSHECRAEDVSEDPFREGDYLYVGVSTYSGDCLFGNGSSLRRKSPKFQMRGTNNQHFVNCEEVNAKFISFDEVLRNLQSDCSYGFRRLYTELIYTHLGVTYRLYTPCRYLNFPNPELEKKKYLQPISGYVLFEEEEQFYLAYVVAHIADGETKSIQFRLHEQTNYFKTVAWGKKYSLIPRLLNALPAVLYAAGYERVVRISGSDMQCRFFSYQ